MSLTLVPTPIGNLRDITLRALDALRECDAIVAEDTRVSRKLLSAHGITGKPLVSLHARSAPAALAAVVERGKTDRIAVVTDAGMPGISDPGGELVRAARAAGVGVEVLPGPTAFVCAAVLSGFALDRLTFAGFLPRAERDRRAAFAAALASGTTHVWYESPHRVVAAVATLEALAPDAELFVARELTKLFEEHIYGSPAAVRAKLGIPPRGEFVLVLAPAELSPADAQPIDDLELDAVIDRELVGGRSAATVAKSLAQRGLGKRAALYARIVARKQRR
ncbi:MAG: 16S rRNA (cytidine(1402)-2'-O)-methyltransferase [Vulcanimicrobiaceae bacterium]